MILVSVYIFFSNDRLTPSFPGGDLFQNGYYEPKNKNPISLSKASKTEFEAHPDAWL
jgi:hypothetical protein